MTTVEILKEMAFTATETQRRALEEAISALSDYKNMQEISLDLAFENDELINKSRWNPLKSDEEGRIIGSLPEEGKEVFVTVYGQVEIDSFGCDVEYDESVGECRNEWFCENNDIEDVTAWMPLPEPYKEERGE